MLPFLRNVDRCLTWFASNRKAQTRPRDELGRFHIVSRQMDVNRDGDPQSLPCRNSFHPRQASDPHDPFEKPNIMKINEK